MKQQVKKLVRDFLHTNFDFPWIRHSYSQFGEDSILRSIIESELWGAWEKGDRSKGKKVKDYSGFYVDIGAFAPKQYSNTYWLYKQGWKGINVDATPGSMKNFRAARKRDVNLELAVSDKEEKLVYYAWETGGAITNTFSKEQAEKYTEIYKIKPKEITLTTITLSDILDKHAPSNQSIDLFSIDVEGNNLKVLQSNNWEKYIPKYIIVELDDDESNIEQIQSSQIYLFLKEKGYQLKGWACLSLLFVKSFNV